MIKTPGFRSCTGTKKYALHTYKEMIKDGNISDLVNKEGRFPYELTSQMKYKKFVATMYFRQYRVEIKSLGLDWAFCVSDDF